MFREENGFCFGSSESEPVVEIKLHHELDFHIYVSMYTAFYGYCCTRKWILNHSMEIVYRWKLCLVCCSMLQEN